MKIPGIRFWVSGIFSVLLSDALAKAFQQETYIRHIGLVLFHRTSGIRVEQSHDWVNRILSSESTVSSKSAIFRYFSHCS